MAAPVLTAEQAGPLIQQTRALVPLHTVWQIILEVVQTF